MTFSVPSPSSRPLLDFAGKTLLLKHYYRRYFDYFGVWGLPREQRRHNASRTQARFE